MIGLSQFHVGMAYGVGFCLAGSFLWGVKTGIRNRKARQ